MQANCKCNGTKQELVGVILNGILHEGDLEEALVKLEESEDDKFKTIFEHLYKINIDLDLFNKFQVDRIFEARILSVDKAYRSLGLAYKLMAKCDEVAAEKGFKVIKEDSTGLFSQKILAKLGHETLLEIKYEDIKDENDEIIFKTPSPHTSLKIMYKMVGE
ncbi:arylalkylamine N-acetyltransferase 1 [Halyomorpha halys]|uniref:arylalkylamine N-acetyltransferase 1 n=1 Tax=Halyomorpha halys TaxID=286706 RepID=UPI0006D4DB7F|nr:dopamine N-acetyltransferase-like [Halyomorpha halys]